MNNFHMFQGSISGTGRFITLVKKPKLSISWFQCWSFTIVPNCNISSQSVLIIIEYAQELHNDDSSHTISCAKSKLIVCCLTLAYTVKHAWRWSKLAGWGGVASWLGTIHCQSGEYRSMELNASHSWQCNYWQAQGGQPSKEFSA